MNQPSPDQIRAAIAALDPVEKKVLGGLIVVMIHNATRIKDREWVAENFTRLAIVAHGFDEAGEVDADVRVIETFVEASIGRVLQAAYPLFGQVAVDMEARPGGFTRQDACTQALTYFAGGA